MTAESRLTRLYPALTAKERGRLVLQAHKAHEQPDRLIYDTTPREQRDQFNRYIRLMNAANVELAIVLYNMREQIRNTDVKYAWFMTLLIWGLEAQILGDEVLASTKDRKLRRQVRRMMKRAPGDLKAPVDLTPPLEPPSLEQGYGDQLVRALLVSIARSVQEHWCELRAIEVGVQEVADEFGGEDPLQPEVRALIDECRRSCTELRDDVAKYTDIELQEPSEDPLITVNDVSPVDVPIVGDVGISLLDLAIIPLTAGVGRGVGKGVEVVAASRASRSVVNPLAGTTRSKTVLDKMAKDAFHGFPDELDALAAKGTVTQTVGGDGTAYTMIRTPGTLLGRQGTFEWYVDSNKVVRHRFFNPR